MKKKLLFALAIALVATLIVATPTFAFSGIEFHVYDAVTLQPWGSTDGQSYRIYIYGNSSGGRVLLDTTMLTTDGDASPLNLNFTCAYGGECPPDPEPGVTNPTLLTPNIGETVYIFIILTGTSGNPSTITREYVHPGNLGVSYVISQNSGTGPTAITLLGTSAQSPTQWTVAAAILGVAAVGSAALLLRRRRAA
jgi:hypothetical protein